MSRTSNSRSTWSGQTTFKKPQNPSLLLFRKGHLLEFTCETDLTGCVFVWFNYSLNELKHGSCLYCLQSRVCELVDDSSQLFSSPQCLGYRNEHGRLTHEMCFPSTSTVIKQIKRAVKKIKATSVFVASDKNHLLSDLSTALKKMGVTVKKLGYDSPHTDLAILGRSNIFIGNCISSFSAFVKRSRDVYGFPSEFWGFPPNMLNKEHQNRSGEEHDELWFC